MAVGVAVGAEAVDGGRALDGIADGLGHLGHDLDGLGALVVAALDGHAVGVAGLVLGVVHTLDALADGLLSGLDAPANRRTLRGCRPRGLSR